MATEQGGKNPRERVNKSGGKAGRKLEWRLCFILNYNISPPHPHAAKRYACVNSHAPSAWVLVHTWERVNAKIPAGIRELLWKKVAFIGRGQQELHMACVSGFLGRLHCAEPATINFSFSFILPPPFPSRPISPRSPPRPHFLLPVPQFSFRSARCSTAGHGGPVSGSHTVDHTIIIRNGGMCIGSDIEQSQTTVLTDWAVQAERRIMPRRCIGLQFKCDVETPKNSQWRVDFPARDILAIDSSFRRSSIPMSLIINVGYTRQHTQNRTDWSTHGRNRTGGRKNTKISSV